MTDHNVRTALVLGGGGSAGNAWLIGVLAGLFEAGLDVTTAELTIGTSAGSTAAAQIASASPSELFAEILAAPEPRAAGDPSGASSPMRPTTSHLDTTNAIIAAAEDPEDMRRKMGAWALEMAAAADGSAGARWRDTVAARFSQRLWPDRQLLITAVDADTGVPVVIDNSGDVELVDAVAASCAGGFAYAIGAHRYLDGGYRTNAENADLAAGAERALVLSPFGGRTRLPLAWRLDLATQVDELRATGSRVETIFPDASAIAAFGGNMMNLAARRPAAQAGFDQGIALAPQLTEFWG
jgi:NTE family protein